MEVNTAEGVPAAPADVLSAECGKMPEVPGMAKEMLSPVHQCRFSDTLAAELHSSPLCLCGNTYCTGIYESIERD